MPRAVLDMKDRQVLWAMPPWVPERIEDAFPGAWELAVVPDATDGSGDGGHRMSPAVLEAVAGAEIYFGFGVPAELLAAADRLRWVHSGAAGVGSSLTPLMKDRDIVFTNSAGVHAPPMAETVVGMILHFLRGLDLAVRARDRGIWATELFEAQRPRELASCTVGIVGFGGIGREVARRVTGLGARVVATKRTPARDGEGSRDPAVGPIEVGYGSEGLRRVLEESDVVVLSVPETPETRGMLDAAAFARMKEGAILVNVARGKLVDEEALEGALRSGRLRGAGLDVFAQEPLPVGHPFWSLPNVLVTPHVSAVTAEYWARETALIVENVGRYLAGEPLRNTVDKVAGY